MLNSVIVKLSNGKKVANFSSPHDFIFEDGTILPAVNSEIAKELSINVKENKINHKGDVYLETSLPVLVRAEMAMWDSLHKHGNVDVVFCPMMMMQALKNEGYAIMISPFRVIRKIDRISNIISIESQCVI